MRFETAAMKFGKKIASVSASSKALCPPEDWMNYKHLKQLLKDIQNNDPLAAQRSANNHAASTPEKAKRAGSPANGSAVVAKDSDKPLTSSRDSSNLNGKPIVAKKRAGSIVESKYEKIFFSQLKQELQKVTDSFGKLEQRLFARFREFLPKMNRLKQAFEDKHVLVKSEEVSKVVEECAELHFLLVCLESYAVINYAGFTKILKKHDKVTGFTTRDKYMLKLVDEKSFAQHKRIKGVLNAVTLGECCIQETVISVAMDNIDCSAQSLAS